MKVGTPWGALIILAVLMCLVALAIALYAEGLQAFDRAKKLAKGSDLSMDCWYLYHHICNGLTEDSEPCLCSCHKGGILL